MDNSTEKEYGSIQNLYCTDQSIREPLVRPIRDTDDSTSLWKATSGRITVKAKWKKCQDLLSLKEQ